MTDHGILSLAPAALAIGLAFLTRSVILSLFAAVWCAGIILQGGDPVAGLVQAVDPFLVGAIADKDHVKIVLFSVFIGAMVGVMAKGGGTAALVRAASRFARTRRSAQVTSWLAGLVVFFDDYANCLIVGNGMRPLTDRLTVSRAKLAYLVDSTAAPIATLALVSTWVGFEVGLVQEGLEKAGIARDPYAFFVEGWAYRFYPILTIVFVGAVAILGRDFGPMLAAERRAQADGPPADAPSATSPDAVQRGRLFLGLLPILTLVGVTVGVLWHDGKRAAPPDARLFEILGAASSYDAMLKGALAGLIVACAVGLALRALGLEPTVKAAIGGMQELFEALTILFLAWALGSAMKELHAAEYLVSVLDQRLPAALLPTVIFLVGALISFATGTSFGTMAILMPIVIPLAFALAPNDIAIVLASSGSVLAGATFGDHCSPISDTTVLSSLGAGCDLVEHVATQLPYALVVGGISIVFGTLPSGFGAPPWLLLALGAGACVAAVRALGRRP